MSMTIQTDPEHDLLYIAFSERALKRGAVKRTRRISDDIALDFDARARLLGIEIMHASAVLDGGLRDIEISALVGVKEAAALAGVRPQNFVRDYASRPDFPRPVVELGNGRIWLRSQVEQYLSTRARRTRRVSRPCGDLGLDPPSHAMS